MNRSDRRKYDSFSIVNVQVIVQLDILPVKAGIFTFFSLVTASLVVAEICFLVRFHIGQTWISNNISSCCN